MSRRLLTVLWDSWWWEWWEWCDDEWLVDLCLWPCSALWLYDDNREWECAEWLPLLPSSVEVLPDDRGLSVLCLWSFELLDKSLCLWFEWWPSSRCLCLWVSLLFLWSLRLLKLVENLSTSEGAPEWNPLVRLLVSNGRKKLLSDLGVLGSVAECDEWELEALRSRECRAV